MQKVKRESNIENYLIACVKNEGGEVRKVRWIGRRNAPDRFVMLNNKGAFIELKRPGKTPTAAQLRELNRLGASGMKIAWANCEAHIDTFIGDMMQPSPHTIYHFKYKIK